LRDHLSVVLHQILDNANQVRKMLVLRRRLHSRLWVWFWLLMWLWLCLHRMRALVNAEPRTKLVCFTTDVTPMHYSICDN
jgi:hypothetical protein